jgi:hypothetical protein
MMDKDFGRPLGPEQKAKEAKVSDPWVNRSSGMRCRTCLWFVSKEPQALTVTVKSHEVGRCRRHAPTMGGYPVVYMTDWCGDHRVDENKI